MKHIRHLFSHLLSSSTRKVLRPLLGRTVSIVLSLAMAIGQLSFVPRQAFGAETGQPSASDSTTGTPTVVRELTDK
jgi:hypothetical protein